jgi:hypothetical protein
MFMEAECFKICPKRLVLDPDQEGICLTMHKFLRIKFLLPLGCFWSSSVTCELIIHCCNYILIVLLKGNFDR